MTNFIKLILKKCKSPKFRKKLGKKKLDQQREKMKLLSNREREIAKKLHNQNWKGDLVKNPEYAKNFEEIRKNREKK